ncbi:site-specific integrase [Propioniciclava sp. MC1595]|uniref:tyrosine-type recombinase/integrase n=1 Tax=Propioniciclava sp. MC1595 TaxID=2760308 RepID=UPI001AA10187|nr:site-specific integrase [Propioniciclava sp. MC1595]QTE25464.1 site-specific integrase [Propioniciclava sp. MC1595]
MTSTPAPVMWRLGRSLPDGDGTSPVGGGAVVGQSLAQRERSLGLLPGHPFLLRPDGVADADVLAFFASSSFKLLSEQTRVSYAKDLRLFLSFLESQSKSWRDSTPADLLDYEHWRRRDPANPHRVSGAKFSRELAACKKFFDWQRQRGAMAANPAVERATPWQDTGGHSLRPKDARSTRVKWLTPRAFQQWRDVGLGGRLVDDSREASWRGRNDGRNLAFADLLWTSGLRLREAGTLLVSELPETDPNARYLRARVGEAAAKGRGRDFWMAADARRELDGYVASTRATAVSRARREGRYAELPGKLVVVGRDRDRLQVRSSAADDPVTTVMVGQLDARDRARLFLEGPDGLEPAMLFLGESGLPMHYESWEAVFAGASRRCARLGVPVACYPHMLRHSFALRMLVTLLHAFDRRMGLTPDERRDYRLLFGDPWTLVQTLLGHTNPQTTRDIYLEPVSGLQVDLFLNGDQAGASDDAFADFVQRHLADTGLVNLGRES